MAEPLIIEAHDGQRVSPELRPLLMRVYADVGRKPVNRPALKQSLQELLTFLESSSGFTNANCWATDLFFGVGDGWDRDWNHLPDSFGDILADMGSALHDSVNAHTIAAGFDSTPKQLLDRLRHLAV